MRHGWERNTASTVLNPEINEIAAFVRTGRWAGGKPPAWLRMKISMINAYGPASGHEEIRACCSKLLEYIQLMEFERRTEPTEASLGI